MKLPTARASRPWDRPSPAAPAAANPAGQLNSWLRRYPPRPLIKSAVGLYQFQPYQLARPTTETELVEWVKYAAHQGLPIKAIGALHSAVPLPATEGICLCLDRYSQVLAVSAGQVTVQAGIRLAALNHFLAARGLALPILGTIAQQSVAGAIATGTHGGSLHHPSLSGYVQAMRLVSADGTVVSLDRQDPRFDGAAISLGALGIVSTVTLACVPAFALKTDLLTLPMAALLEHFEAIHRHNHYVDIRYAPICDRAYIALMNPDPSGNLAPRGWQPPAPRSPYRQAWDNWLSKSAQRLFATHRFNRLQRWAIARYSRSIYNRPRGRSDFVLTHFDATSIELLANEARCDLEPVADMEVAVAYEQAPEALARIRAHFLATRRFPSMHIHLRCQAADPFWLSPTAGQAVCWVEFWEYPCTGQFLKTMGELLRPFNPRGHWGKQLPMAPAQQYDRWPDFLHLRRQWDPEGQFINAYLERLFAVHSETP